MGAMSVEPILVEKTWPANELESKKTKDLVDGVEAAAATRYGHVMFTAAASHNAAW